MIKIDSVLTGALAYEWCMVFDLDDLEYDVFKKLANKIIIAMEL